MLWVDGCEGEPPFGGQFSRLLAAADGQRRRSVLVLNGLDEALAEMTVAGEANALLEQGGAAAEVFFVSFSLARPNSAGEVAARAASEAASLRRLKAHGRHDARTGMPRLAHRVQSVTRDVYRLRLVPAAMSHLLEAQRKIEAAQTRVATQIAALEPDKLRAFSPLYLTEYLRHFRTALSGAAPPGDILALGQTLAEERAGAGSSLCDVKGWRVSPTLTVPVSVSNVSQSGTKLLGRPAFLRLLSDLSAALSAAPLSLSSSLSSSSSSILANRGPARSGLEPEFVGSASDAAASLVRAVLRPLVGAAVARASALGKRLTLAAEASLARKKDAADVDTMEAPVFCAAIRHLVHDFIEAAASRCGAAVDDAFRATMFVPVAAAVARSVPRERAGDAAGTEEEEELARAAAMGQAVAEELRSHLLETVQLTLVETMLEPLAEQVQNYVQTRMALVRADDIEAYLEPEAARARLLEEQCRLEQELILAKEYVRIFQTHAEDF